MKYERERDSLIDNKMTHRTNNFNAYINDDKDSTAIGLNENLTKLHNLSLLHLFADYLL